MHFCIEKFRLLPLRQLDSINRLLLPIINLFIIFNNICFLSLLLLKSFNLFLIFFGFNFSNPKTKLYNREIGGLLKGAVATGCSNLTLIMMSGETGDLAIEGKTIHRVLASDWLLSRK